MKEQKYFERTINGFDWQKDKKTFYTLLENGWKVKLAIPVQDGRSCHTYTYAIHYVLEREVEQ